MSTRCYVHSPFTESAHMKETKGLLMQFILQELFNLHKLIKIKKHKGGACKPPCSIACLREHCSLLYAAFPGQHNHIQPILYILFSMKDLLHRIQIRKSFPLRKIFFLLEPFLKECKNEPCLLFFLLSHQEDVVLLSHHKYLLSFFQDISPKGVSRIQEDLCDHFYARGFPYRIPQIKSLFLQLQSI